MKKLGKVSIVALSLFVTFIAGALIVRAQHPVPHGDVFACFSQGNGYLVEDPVCESDETLVSWYSSVLMHELQSSLLDLFEGEAEARVEADEALNEADEALNEADEALNEADEALNEADEALQGQVDDLEQRVADLESLLQHFSRSGNDVKITGANLHVVNGEGTTSALNALGNVIIGYNEARGSGNDRSGSHMLVVGRENNYSSAGGIVAGRWNETSGIWSSVTGGGGNIASGEQSSVTGGGNNIASHYVSSVSGGNHNIAEAPSSSVSGGNDNLASGGYASISGGKNNVASGAWAAVGGGDNNSAVRWYSSIGGGTTLTTTLQHEFLP